MMMYYISAISRIMRGSMIETMNSNFIRTARAKGLPLRHIILKHALRPAMLPVVSYLGPAFRGHHHRLRGHRDHLRPAGIGQLFVNGASTVITPWCSV